MKPLRLAVVALLATPLAAQAAKPARDFTYAVDNVAHTLTRTPTVRGTMAIPRTSKVTKANLPVHDGQGRTVYRDLDVTRAEGHPTVQGLYLYVPKTSVVDVGGRRHRVATLEAAGLHVSVLPHASMVVSDPGRDLLDRRGFEKNTWKMYESRPAYASLETRVALTSGTDLEKARRLLGDQVVDQLLATGRGRKSINYGTQWDGRAPITTVVGPGGTWTPVK